MSPLFRGTRAALAKRNSVPPPSGLSYGTNPATYVEDSAISTNSATVTGIVTSYSVSPALPDGLSLNTSTGAITGTPTTPTAAATYVVTASNSGGSTTCNLSITISLNILGMSPLVWLRADTGVTQAGTVSAIEDQSSNDNDFVQNTAGNRPAYNATDADFNGGPSIDTTGSKWLVSDGTVAYGANGFTAYLVFKAAAGLDAYMFGHQQDAGNFHYLTGDNNGSIGVRHSAGTASWKNASNEWAGGVAKTVCWGHPVGPGSHAAAFLRINGVAETLTTLGGNNGNPAAADVTAVIGLGSDAPGSLPHAFKFVEFILFSTVHSDGDKALVEAELKRKHAHYV
jgi:hypothetical protein